MRVFQRYFLITLFSLLTSALLNAQDKEGFFTRLVKGDLDTSYIRDYKDEFTGRFYLLSQSIGFRINPRDVGPDVEYSPNIYTKVGLAGFYKWFGMGIAVKNPLHIRDSRRKGTSSIIDVRINAYGKALAGELSFQDYKGFYLGDSDKIITGWTREDDYYQRPDMEIRAIGAILYYLFNSDKHSIRAAYIQNEQQLKSSGALMVVPSFLYTSLRSDSSLVPSAYLQKFTIDEDEKIINGKFYNTGLSLGYSYTMVFLDNFYINASLIPGAFYQNSSYTYQGGDKSAHNFTLLWLGRWALGYNSRKFYAGAGGVFGYNPSPLSIGNTNFNFDMNQVRLWVGTHFDVRQKQKLK